MSSEIPDQPGRSHVWPDEITSDGVEINWHTRKVISHWDYPKILWDHLRLWRTRQQDQVVTVVTHFNWETIVALAVGSTTLGAFVQAIAAELGKRTVEGVPKTIRVVVRYAKRFWRKKLVSAEVKTEVGDITATLIVTSDLPDEARLALLDLDFSDPGLNGKTLSWNIQAGVWELKRDSLSLG